MQLGNELAHRVAFLVKLVGSCLQLGNVIGTGSLVKIGNKSIWYRLCAMLYELFVVTYARYFYNVFLYYFGTVHTEGALQ